MTTRLYLIEWREQFRDKSKSTWASFGLVFQNLDDAKREVTKLNNATFLKKEFRYELVELR